MKCADTVGTGEGGSGYDAGKKIKGRKRHILTDTQGLLLGVTVTPASVQDRDGAKVVCSVFCHQWQRLEVIFADGGYAGKLEGFIQQAAAGWGHAQGLRLEIIKRSEEAKGFVLLAKRWVVERTFGWLMKCRRLNRDQERDARHHESLIYLAMISLNLRILSKA
ncbi:MAG TPA: transposase [Prosthecobacter sp.]|nr:transposase [Prosthecobacter sp.]HRK12745.1 transposase [Prosthecobacter sp.]